MYDNVFKMRNKSSSIHVSSLQRPEWQQPIDILPPITKRLPGQRRRRILGSFPQTENDVSCSRKSKPRQFLLK